MNLASLKTIKFLCQKYKFWPSRKSGQNFLVSEKVLHSIVQSAQLKEDDVVLEIGAGFGTLTAELLKTAQKVVAVELDKRLVKALKKLALLNKNLKVVEGDIFKQWPVVSRQLTDLSYKLVANLPYNITSLVLRNFLEQKPRPKEMTVLVQKEVAERVVAKPGQMSLLAVAVQFYGQPEIMKIVSKDNFWPRPEVDSAVLKIQGISGLTHHSLRQGEAGGDNKGYQWLLGDVDIKKFFSVVKTGFSAKRKQLHNNLAAGWRISNKKAKEILSQSGINPTCRAQDLSIENWAKIAQNIDIERRRSSLTF